MLDSPNHDHRGRFQVLAVVTLTGIMLLLPWLGPLLKPLKRQPFWTTSFAFWLEVETYLLFLISIHLVMRANNQRMVDLLALNRPKWARRDFLGAVGLTLTCYLVIIVAHTIDQSGAPQPEYFRLVYLPLDISFAIVAALVAAATEEILFRGYLLDQFTLLLRSDWQAGLLQALLFAAAHGAQTLNEFLLRLLLGLIWGVSRRVFRTLIPAIASHATIDAVTSVGLLLMYHSAGGTPLTH